jgi:hypothetical protein
MLFTLVGSSSWVISAAERLTLMRARQPASRSLQARGLRRIMLVVPEGCAESLLHLARQLLISDSKQTWATIHEIAATSPEPSNTTQEV